MLNASNRLFLCVIIFGLSVGIGLGICQYILPTRSSQPRGTSSQDAALYEPNMAADRVHAAEALQLCAGTGGHSITEYVDEAEKLANSINEHALPKYRGADRISIANAAQVMATLGPGYDNRGAALTPAQLAVKARPFIEESIPR